MNKQNSKYRWVVFGSVLAAYLFIVSQRTAPGLITDQLMAEFQLTAVVIGLMTSIQFFAYAGLQIPIGLLSDRFGPNLFLIIGTLLSGVGTLVYSVADNGWILVLARLLCGIGDATIWVNLVLILSQWFKVQEFSMLVGLAGMTGSFGFLLATVPFSTWIASFGWRAPFFVVGIVLVLLGMLLYFVLVKQPERRFPIEKANNKSKEKYEKTSVVLRRLISSRQAWATFLCHFGVVGTYIGFIGSWAVPYGMDMYSLSRSNASQLIMYGLIGAIIGAPLTSWISNKIQSIKRPYLIIHVIVLACWSIFLLFEGRPSYPVLIILFFIIGYANGASTLTFAVVRQSFNIKEVGLVSGFANTGGFLSAVLLPSIFGKILDYFNAGGSLAGYHYGFIIPVLFAAVGLLGGILLREPSVSLSEVKEQAM
ncbi:MFS transporter [Cytobacillus horneckiae]|uniref:MFS transporter n=1 Tax=Cytobacillus horneckiae TaxID=549687 RepID=A0A2N0ZC36_9BACI|nr:MFS transporter [Cytobacillus horneckiae]MCM3177498.1 MFS transporter [Cytobacillus horneckiae]MEC1155939.1 MFS transporter [Cytobacillus horneckiae]MED2939785.1 MFS transporter [Cytobacillus horneckiae]PKG27091.1 MFS transporter [Cytobacillus horneckiae]